MRNRSSLFFLTALAFSVSTLVSCEHPAATPAAPAAPSKEVYYEGKRVDGVDSGELVRFVDIEGTDFPLNKGDIVSVMWHEIDSVKGDDADTFKVTKARWEVSHLGKHLKGTYIKVRAERCTKGNEINDPSKHAEAPVAPNQAAVDSASIARHYLLEQQQKAAVDDSLKKIQANSGKGHR